MHSNKPLTKNNLIHLCRTNLVACSLQIDFCSPLTNFGGKYKCKTLLCTCNRSTNSHICKKETKIDLYENHRLAKNLTVSLSGGQDSSFLLFYLSFLQAQLTFNCNSIWCNHFWQIDSFYTTLHLTKYALAFSSPIVGFLPFQITSSPSFYKTVATKYKKTVKLKFYKKKQSETEIGFLKQKFFRQSCLSLRTLSLHYRVKACKINKIKTNSSPYKNFFVLSKKHLSNCKASQTLTPYKWRSTPFALMFKTCNPYLRTSCPITLSLSEKSAGLGYKYKCKALLYTLNRGIKARNKSFYGKILKKQSFFFVGVDKAIPFRKAHIGTNVSNVTKLLFYKFYARQRLANLCSSFLRENKKKKSKGLSSPPSNATLKKTKAYKKAIKKLSETRARNWRHIATERVCAFYGSNKCVYGHTLSDRVETILFNLIRGTGKKGVQCLPSKRRYSTFCYNKFYPVLEQVIKNTHINLV